MITEGDKVRVNINAAGMTLMDSAEVLHVPVATGDAWGFRDKHGVEIWTTEGITICKFPEPTP